ncbi:MAG: hypothetical protein JMN25_18025 [gamma proteobacterium endosymbiont of Lamellibrachia anaximandri]|nr:hypothetical protein [gamma proteobacterium endosymbiont of Lamellibrachia anaximandri]
MKAILHIGCEKTGTTSLQESLYLNKSNLEEQGYFFSQAAGKRNHNKLFVCSLEKERLNNDLLSTRMGIYSYEKQCQEKLLLEAKIEEEIRNLPAGVKKVIYSSEHLQARLQTQNAIKNLFDMLSGYFTEFEIIVYLRNPMAYAVSLFSTSLKFGNISNSIAGPYVGNGELNYRFNYKKMICNWQSVFGKSSVRPLIFDKMYLVNSNVVDDYYAKLNIDCSNFIPIDDKLNLSLMSDAQAFLLQVNKRLSLNSTLDSSAKSKIVRNLVSRLEQIRGGSGIRPSMSLCYEFELAFSESNEWVKNNYFPDYKGLSNNCGNYESDAEKNLSISTESTYDIIIELLAGEISG